MRRLLAALVLVAVLIAPARAASGVNLDIVTTEHDVFFMIASDAPRHLYVQLDGEGGATVQSATIYECDINAGELFGRRIEASGPGSVRVRVWASDGGTAPVAGQVLVLPAYRHYLPLFTR